METLSASHFPHHLMGMKPLLARRSCAVVSFLKRPPLVSVVVWPAAEVESRLSPVEEASVVAPEPGCLTMPKFLGEG